MPTMGYGAAELYYIKARESLSLHATPELESVVESFQSKPLYKWRLHSALSTRTYIHYSAARNILDSRNDQ